MSEIKVNSIKGVGASTAAITVNNSDGTCTANLSNRQGRNLIINGAMTIAQRGSSSTASDYGSVDRFRVRNSNTDEAAFTQSQVTDSPDGFGNSLEIDITTAESAIASDELFIIRTILEANSLQSLAFGTSSANQITLSFYVKAYQTGTYVLNLYSDDSARSYTANYTINQSATWERKTITFAGDTVGTITNDNGAGLYLNWFLAAGTNYTSSTAHKNQWASFVTQSWAHGQTVNVLSSTDNYWKLTGVQLEVSDHATDFEHENTSDTLLKCQRYFQVFKTADAVAGNTTGLNFTATMFCTMRATPSAGKINYQGNATFNFGDMVSVADTSTNTPTFDSYINQEITITGAIAGFDNLTAYRSYKHEPTTTNSALISADAELN